MMYRVSDIRIIHMINAGVLTSHFSHIRDSNHFSPKCVRKKKTRVYKTSLFLFFGGGKMVGKKCYPNWSII